jgi:hypothetical protein
MSTPTQSCRPILSFCYHSRNDDYFGDLKHRLKLSLDLLCKGLSDLGRLDATEIIVSDWGSEVPLARELALSPAARSKVKFLYVPPVLAKRTHDDPIFPATLALNAAFRRAAGEFISTLDSDILLTRASLRALFNVLEDPPLGLDPRRVLWFANRRRLPVPIVSRKPSPLEIEEYLERNVAYLESETLRNGYGAGAFYLMHRDLAFAVRAFDERMRWWGWSDTDIALRCNQHYPTLELSNFGVLAVHQEHGGYDRQHHDSSGRKYNLPDCNPRFVVNDENWGLARETLSFMQAEVEEDPAPADRTSRTGTIEVWSMTRAEFAREIESPANEARIQPILPVIQKFMRLDGRELNALRCLAWYAATQGVMTFVELGLQLPQAMCAVRHNSPGAELHGLHCFFNRGPGPEANQPTEVCNYFDTCAFLCIAALRRIGPPFGFVRFTGGNPDKAVSSLCNSSAGRFAYDLALVRCGASSPYRPEQSVELGRYVRPGGMIVVYGEDSAAFQQHFGALAVANPAFSKCVFQDGQTGVLLAASLVKDGYRSQSLETSPMHEHRETFREQLLNRGVVLLRSAIDPARVRHARMALFQAHALYEAKLREEGLDLPALDVPTLERRAGEGRAWQIAFHLKIGQFMPEWFQAAVGWSMYDLISTPALISLAQTLLGPEVAASPFGHSRRLTMDSARHCNGWFAPKIGWHADAQYHSPNRFTLNFWVPLDECGVDAPGLELIPLSLSASREVLNYPQRMLVPERLPDALAAAGLLDKSIKPEMRVGDVLVFSNWTIHQTHVTPNMTGDRASFELRLVGAPSPDPFPAAGGSARS